MMFPQMMTPLRPALSPEQVERLAILLDAGQGPDLRDLSADDVVRILGAVVTIKLERLRAADELDSQKHVKGSPSTVSGQARNPGRSPGQIAKPPSNEIIAEILQSPEMQIVLNILAAALTVIARLPVSAAPLGATQGLRARDGAQSRYLYQYLQQKIEGDPVIQNGVRIGWESPQTRPHPNADRIHRNYRIWANTLPKVEAKRWLEHGAEGLKRRLHDIDLAGTSVCQLYGRAFDSLRLPLDAIYSGEPWFLPGLYPPETYTIDVPDLKYTPTYPPTDELGGLAPTSSP